MNAQCSAEAELSGYMEREMLWKMILMQKLLHCVQSREKDNGQEFHKQKTVTKIIVALIHWVQN